MSKRKNSSNENADANDSAPKVSLAQLKNLEFVEGRMNLILDSLRDSCLPLPKWKMKLDTAKPSNAGNARKNFNNPRVDRNIAMTKTKTYYETIDLDSD